MAGVARDGRTLNRAVLAEIRQQAVLQVEAGESPEAVISALGFSRSCIYEWVARYRANGLEAVAARRAPGRVPKLSDRQLRRLRRLVGDKDPRQLECAFGLWTRAMVRDLIRREFGVTVSESSVGRLLHKLGLSRQRPLCRAYQQDREQVTQWRAVEYPQIRAAARRAGATIYFGDEAAVRSDHHAGTTWAPVGQTPPVAATGARFGLNLVSAVTPGGGLRFQIIRGMLTAPRFIEFCRRLLADSGRPVYLIVDPHAVHHSAAVTRYVATTTGRLRLFFLPSHSPQLNPDEWVWRNVKGHRLGPSQVTDAADLKRQVPSALHRLQRLPQLVRGFFHDPALRYIVAPDVR